jgi:hypothetical protein
MSAKQAPGCRQQKNRTDALSVLARGYPAFVFATARFAMVYAREILRGKVWVIPGKKRNCRRLLSLETPSRPICFADFVKSSNRVERGPEMVQSRNAQQQMRSGFSILQTRPLRLVRGNLPQGSRAQTDEEIDFAVFAWPLFVAQAYSLARFSSTTHKRGRLCYEIWNRLSATAGGKDQKRTSSPKFAYWTQMSERCNWKIGLMGGAVEVAGGNSAGLRMVLTWLLARATSVQYVKE